MDNKTSSPDTMTTTKGSKIANGTNNANSRSSVTDGEQSSDAGDTALNLDDLSAYIKSDESTQNHRGIPPLDKWHPDRVGSMDLVIKDNGEWWHEGTKITRHSLVQLFSTVLWAEDNEGTRQYYLKTPVEKILIEVEDVPFLINDVNVVIKEDEPWLEFVTTTGDVIYLDHSHPIIMRNYKSQMRPYIEVRLGMYGLISRSVLMHLTQLGAFSKHDDMTILTLQSGGERYQISVLDDE